MTLAAAAAQLGTDLGTIVTLTDQIADDADLYNAATETLTPAGLGVIADQLAAE